MKNIKIQISSIGINAEGVAKVNGNVFFIPFALSNEEVEVKIIKEKDNLKFCKLQNILKPSEFRVEPRCKYFGICGGCNLQHLDYLESLKYKKNLVQETLKKIAGIDVIVNNVVSSNCYNYRNKMVFPIGYFENKNMVGMFKEKSHNIVPINKCEIADENINLVLDLFNKFVHSLKLQGYYLNEKNGILKYVGIRILNNFPCVTIVATKNVADEIKSFSEVLKDNFKKYSLWLNINNKKTSEILGDKFIFIGGEKQIYLNEFGIDYSVHPYSFMQVNNEIKQKLYKEILNNIGKENAVIDAYSGAGLLSAIIAKRAKKVYGIEIVESATNDANILKINNNIQNLDNINGDTAKKLPEILKIEKHVTVVLDPPKSGLDKRIVDALNESNVDKIIYVACGLTTLCRDLKLLKDNYEITKVQPFDMFPNTNHIETLVCLQKRVKRMV